MAHALRIRRIVGWARIRSGNVENEPPKVEAPEKPTKYVVKKGDSLWKIAGKVYHNPLKWPRIYRANKEKIKNPNRIFANQFLNLAWIKGSFDLPHINRL